MKDVLEEDTDKVLSDLIEAASLIDTIVLPDEVTNEEPNGETNKENSTENSDLRKWKKSAHSFQSKENIEQYYKQ